MTDALLADMTLLIAALLALWLLATSVVGLTVWVLIPWARRRRRPQAWPGTPVDAAQLEALRRAAATDYGARRKQGVQ